MGKLWASQSTGIRRGICVLVVCFFVHASGGAQVAGAPASKAPSSHDDGKGTSERLSFVREFSSAEDVKRAHPVLDRTLDIIAGPKQDGRPVDVLEIPYAVTTDSAHRVFVTDVGAKPYTFSTSFMRSIPVSKAAVIAFAGRLALPPIVRAMCT